MSIQEHNVAWCFVLALAASNIVKAGQVTFDNYKSPADNDLVNYFSGSTASYQAVPSGGITGGAVQVVAPLASYPVYQTSFDLAYGITTSLFFKYDQSNAGTGVGPTVQLGICGSPSGQIGNTNDPTAYFWAQFYNDGALALYSKAVEQLTGNGFIPLGSFSPPFGDWLRLSLDVRPLSRPNGFELDAALYDYGPNGTGTPSGLGSGGTALFDANAAADRTLYVGFNGWYHVSYFDNFSVIPEPNGMRIIMLGGLLAFVRKFKRQSRQRVNLQGGATIGLTNR
jgi:hypothetical protein